MKRQAIKVVTSAHPEAQLAKLSLTEQSQVLAFINANMRVTLDVAKSNHGPANMQGVPFQAPGSESLTGGAVIPLASSGCFYNYSYINWTFLYLRVGSAWMQLNWCHNGSRVTSYNVSNIGGKGVGITYLGKAGPYFLDIGWEVRAAVKYKYGVGGKVSFDNCLQVRWGAGLTKEFPGECDLQAAG